MINDIANDFSPLITSSLTKFVRCAIYHRKMDAVRHFIFKNLPSAIPEFVAYLNQRHNAFNDLCGKTLGKLSF